MIDLDPIRLEVRATSIEPDGSATLRLIPEPAPGEPRPAVNYGEPGVLLRGLPTAMAGLGGRVFRAVLTLEEVVTEEE